MTHGELKALVERLHDFECANCGHQGHVHDEAADHIEKLEADNARLREALEWALCEIRSDTRYDNEEQFLERL